MPWPCWCAMPAQLVTKDRFLDDVWRGVPVTDEALTQCIKTLRRLLGDNAASPRLIETVPKHGYRFIAPVETGTRVAEGASRAVRRCPSDPLLGAAGTIGGGLAGLLVGLFYGFAGASQPLQPGMGAVSMLLVLVCLSTIAALIGAVGISFGIAAAGFARNRWPWTRARRRARRAGRRRLRQIARHRRLQPFARPVAGRHHRRGRRRAARRRDRAWRLARPARGRAARPAPRHRRGRARRRRGRGRHSPRSAGG